MSFDPDAFLEATAPAAPALKPFDPDEFLASTAPAAPAAAAFDPDQFLKETEPSWLEQRANELKRGTVRAGQMLDVAELQGAGALEQTAQRRLADPAAAVHPLDRFVAKIFPGASDALQANPEAVQRAAAQSQKTAQEMRTRGAQSLAGHTAEEQRIPRSSAMQAFDQAEGTGAAAMALLRNPIAGPADLMLNSLPAAAGGMALGAVAGSQAGPGGTMAGTFMGSLAPEYAGKMQEVAQDMGVNTRDPKQIEAFFADPEKVKAAAGLALRKGVPIAALDALTAGVAGRWIGPALGKGSSKVLLATAKEGAVQAAGAAGGETVGQLLSGEELSGKSILAEVVADLPGAIQETATNLYHERGNRPAGPATPLPNEPAPAAMPPAPQSSSGVSSAGDTAAPPAGAAFPAPSTAPAADPIAELVAAKQAEADTRKAQAEADVTERTQRQTELQDRRAMLAGHLERAEQTIASPDASWAQVQGAATTLEQYQGDNSLKLPKDQLARIDSVGAALTARLKALRPAEEARIAAAAEQTAQQAKATQAAARSERLALEKADRTGRATDGRITDITRLPQQELERIAELEDYAAEQLTAPQVQAELDRRTQLEERAAAQEQNAGRDLLTVLRQVKLPAQDTALGAELQQLVTEGMDQTTRRRIVSNTRTSGLDSVAEQLREEHGFSQIQTPADVIDAVQRALRGEQVLPQGAVDFARPRKPRTAQLSEGRKAAIWQRLDVMLPELTKQVDIELAMTRMEYHRALQAEVGRTASAGTEAAAIPSNVRRNAEAAEARRNAIIFAAEAWTSDRKGVKRLLHESAHVFFWTLPDETHATLGKEYAMQLAAAKALQDHFSGGSQLSTGALAQARQAVGPLWNAEGQLHSDLEGLEDGNEHGMAEWFAELTMWRNRQWALRRFVHAGTLTGRLRLIIDDAADSLREIFRQVAGAFVRQRGQDFAADFWERSFRDFLSNGAQWGNRQQSAAMSYARKTEYATPSEPTPLPEKPARSLTPEQAAAEGIGPGADPLAAIRLRLRTLETQRTRMSAEGGSIAAYNHISEEIRDLQDQRRRLERAAAPVASEPAEPEASTEEQAPAEADLEPSPFNAAEPTEAEQRAEADATAGARAQKVQDLEGRSAVTPAWYTRTWDKALELIRGFKGPLPELPTFPGAFWNRHDPFLQGDPQFYNNLKQGYRIAQRMDGTVRRGAEDRLAAVVRPLLAAARIAGRKHDPAQYQRLMELQARASRAENRGQTVPAALRQEIAAMQSRIENDPYVLFSRLVMYLDLQWRAQNLKTDQGQPITLPMGLTLPDIETRLGEIRQRIAASGQAQAIATALKTHTDLVAEVAQDLNTRELLPQDTLQNPFYFPHLVLTQTSNDTQGRVIQKDRELRLEKVTVDTGEAFRGYLLDPVGSDRPIETDYTKAMFYHLVQVGAHNAMADVRDQWFKSYDIRNTVADRARQLSRQRGTTVSWRQAFEEEFKEKGYVLMTADLGRSLIPALTIDRDRLAQRLGAAIGEGDLQSELAKLGVKGIKILPEDVRESLMAGEKELWVVPARVAEALKGIERRANLQDHMVEKVMGQAVGFWKRWMLFAPHNWLRYEFNNRVADLEKFFSADPAAFRYLPRAFREVHAFYDGTDQAKITPEVRAAFQHGVVGGITAEEIGKLPELNQLSELATDKQKLWTWMKGRTTTAFSRLDESAFRYAKFLADLERIREGARPVYAGAYWRDIEHLLQGNRPEVAALERDIDALKQTIEERRQRSLALTGAARDEAIAANARAGSRMAEAQRRLAALPDSRPELAAAEISNRTFGDYGDVSVNGQWLRAKLTPFWSWTEVNFKYHANLFRNFRDAVVAGDQSAAAAAKAGSRAAAVFAFTLTRKGAALFLTRLALPYIAVSMWNNGDDDRRKIEDELSEEDRRRFHIIVGRNDDRTPDVIYFPTAFSDIAKWFGGPDFARLATEVLKGQTDMGAAIDSWTQQIVPDTINNLVGQIGPAMKIPYVMASKKNPFPDVTDQRTIPKYDYWRSVVSQATDQFTASMIWRAVDGDFVDPRTMGTWAKQLILQMRRRDPESWAFYAIKDKAAGFVEARTGMNRDPGGYDAPEAQVMRQFRRAIYQGDVQTAAKMYDRLLGYGYTSDRFAASIRSQHPLSGVPTALRSDFVESLTPYERGTLDRAMKYYTRMGEMKDSAKRLFPKKGATPRQNEIYQRMFQPRPDLLQREIDTREQMPEAEIERRAQRSLRQAAGAGR